MEEGIKITSNLSEICNNSVVLCKYGEIVIPAYVLNNFNNIYYLYAQNREWHQIDSTLICDYCIIPEADYILKRD